MTFVRGFARVAQHIAEAQRRQLAHNIFVVLFDDRYAQGVANLEAQLVRLSDAIATERWERDQAVENFDRRLDP